MHGIKLLKMSVFAIAFALLVMPNNSAASPATSDDLNTPWGNFSFGQPDSFADACTICGGSGGGNSFFLGSPPWTFTGSAFLIVQDAFISGDQFRVFDGPTLLGDTSVPGILTTGCVDPAVCFTNDNYSSGIFSLAPGPHSFTIQAIASPFSGGEAFFCVSTSRSSCSPVAAPEPLPEPTSILLLGLGLAAAVYWVKRPRFSEILVQLVRKSSRPRIR